MPMNEDQAPIENVVGQQGRPKREIAPGSGTDAAQPKRKRKRVRGRKKKQAAPIPSVLNTCEKPKIERSDGLTRRLPQYCKRIDSETKRERTEVPMSDNSEAGPRTIVVTNPHGTGFMSRAGMSAILVKFQGHHADVKLDSGKLYNMTLKEDNGDQIEMLYFTSHRHGKQGEILLLKWLPEHKSLRPIVTVAQGNDLDQSHYVVDEGHSWTVQAIYAIRDKVMRPNVIEEIRKDIMFLENIKRMESDRIDAAAQERAEDSEKQTVTSEPIVAA